MDTATTLAARVAGIDGAAALIGHQMAAARERAAAIGDGRPGYPGQPAAELGELAAARADAARHTVGSILDSLWPARESAVRARARAELRALADASAERRRADAEAETRRARRQIVNL